MNLLPDELSDIFMPGSFSARKKNSMIISDDWFANFNSVVWLSCDRVNLVQDKAGRLFMLLGCSSH